MACNFIFRTMQWAGENKITGQVLNVNGRWESRKLRLNFNYRFGSNLVKQARQRKSSVEEENKRTQGGGGIGQ